MEPSILKSHALLERISQIVAEYENKIADLRVEITLLSEQNEDYKNQLSAPAEQEPDSLDD